MFEEVKNYLNITWNDTDTDIKIKGIIERAKSKLNEFAGESIDFDSVPHIKQLLFDCCRYIYYNAYEDFKINFRDDLIMLRAEYATKKVFEDET